MVDRFRCHLAVFWWSRDSSLDAGCCRRLVRAIWRSCTSSAQLIKHLPPVMASERTRLRHFSNLIPCSRESLVGLQYFGSETRGDLPKAGHWPTGLSRYARRLVAACTQTRRIASHRPVPFLAVECRPDFDPHSCDLCRRFPIRFHHPERSKPCRTTPTNIPSFTMQHGPVSSGKEAMETIPRFPWTRCWI